MARSTFLLGLFSTALIVEVACAAAPVVESQPIQPTSPRPSSQYPPAAPSSSAVKAYGAGQSEVVASDTRSAPPSATVSSSVGQAGVGSSTTSMFQQLQQLQDDLAQLRGVVEEQGHQIERLQADQKEQYLDLDGRVAALSGSGSGNGSSGGPSAGPAAVPTAGPTPGQTTSMGGGPVVAPAGAGASERDAYTAAFNLTKAKRFNEAIDAFNQMLVTYPHGEYSGNAYYWLGELYLALPEPSLEKARQSFTQVVNQYPTNTKVSDSMYKLGVVYYRLGDRTQALAYLNRVQSQFPGTQAARLAQAYAAELR
jgi:tol-pal system protein YbgF